MVINENLLSYQKGSRMNDELVERIESNPKYKELVSKRNGF